MKVDCPEPGARALSYMKETINETRDDLLRSELERIVRFLESPRPHYCDRCKPTTTKPI